MATRVIKAAEPLLAAQFPGRRDQQACENNSAIDRGYDRGIGWHHPQDARSESS
jgi:hypothetical protein